jgi:hypothetical protein
MDQKFCKDIEILKKKIGNEKPNKSNKKHSGKHYQ